MVERGGETHFFLAGDATTLDGLAGRLMHDHVPAGVVETMSFLLGNPGIPSPVRKACESYI